MIKVLNLNLNRVSIPKKVIKSNRVMKALTGLKKAELIKLSDKFENVLEEGVNTAKPNRKRRPGGGRKHTLSGVVEKLFFILFYLKCYPTFDVAGFIFGVDRAQTCRWVHKLLPVLEKALGKEAVLPCRQIHTVEEFIALLRGKKDVFFDGTERPIQRPSHDEEQKENYSGKKKRHTKKNIVVSDENRRILVLTKTEAGKQHDYDISKKDAPLSKVPDGVGVWVDLGFQGIKKDYPQLEVEIPNKKPSKRDLTPEQKAENRIISGIRVISENAICGIKRLKAAADIYRNHKKLVADKFMLLACGIWNFHLKMELG